ncbi:MAG TPA: PIN domain-containing protein [Gammaproteobacteria bacterium]|nr:PIN domain-containing protein [Gammaproteobacteria bacterium]
MILLDTSGVLAAIDASQRHHAECRGSLGSAAPPFLLSPFVLAELDYLLMRYVGSAAQRSLLEEVAKGAFQLEPFRAGDVERASAVIEKFGDLALGLADASIVVLAERHSAGKVLTLDQRHFRALRFSGRRRFTLLPFD